MPNFYKTIAVAGVSAALAFGAIDHTVPVAAATLSIATPIPLAGVIACELYCWEEPHYCEAGEHDAWVSEDSGTWDSLIQGGSHNGQPCWSGDCVTMHSQGMCEPVGHEAPLAVGDLEGLRLAIANRDAVALRRFVTSFPTQITVNVDRAAVQVVTCAGVVAHLPAPSALVGELATFVDSF